MKEFRCTRRAPYKNPNCPGHTDLSARQGYYIVAVDAAEARAQMQQDFPQDVKAGFDFDIEDPDARSGKELES